MKRSTKQISLAAILLFSAITSNARNLYTNGQQPIQSSATSNKVEAGDCRIPVSQIDLNINNVRARILNAGDMWWDFSNAKYEVPKGDGKLPINAIFAGAIWISGLDAGGNLKIAAQTYRQGNSDFWSGPIYSVGGTVSSSTCDIWDKHFNVYGADIKLAQQQFAATGKVANVPEDVAKWPGKGNKTLEGLGFDMNANLAPFHDEDKDGLYDPNKGDYPVISVSGKPTDSYADQMIFWTMNDKGNTHTATSGQPMGISINSMAFAFQTTDEVNNMTFYTYNITNQSNNVYSKTYMTQFVDADLGCSENDRIGCDTARSLGIVYNGVLGGNPCDNGNACLSGTNGYGCELPMMGFDFFEGPVDTGKNAKQLGMSSFQYFNRANSPKGDPTSAAQYRNYQTGFWRDGSPVKYGGDGYGTGFSTPYVYPGDPSIANQWSECNPQVGAPIDAGDRRLLQTSGPFTFLPGSTQTITIGVVFVRPAGGVTAGCPSYNAWIGAADDKAQALFNTGFKLVDGPDAPNLSIRELDKELIININNVNNNNVGESYDKFDALIATSTGFVKGMDSTYTFQGYKVYQLKDDKVSATDLDDPTKALLLTEEGGLMDLKDDVKRLVNYTRDPILNIYYPTVNLELPNNGITHSLRILKDKFTGSPLVNHKTYYYAAVAFASNEFKKYDPGNPTVGGQKTTYLQGAKNFAKYSAIPHGVESRNEGSTLQSLWGDAATVRRIEGANNGGNELNLTQETVDEIVKNGFKDTLEYVKTYDPIGFKVTDPIQLKEANFELQFIADTNKKIKWELRDLTNLDTIRGDRYIESPYEQPIISQRSGNTDFDYGFSLKLGAPVPVYKNIISKNYVYAPIGGTIEYKDPSRPWLAFVKDAGQNDASNWIRSGNYLATGNPNTNQFVFDANRSTVGIASEFTDSLQLFDKIADGAWAPYCLTPSYSTETGGVAGAPLSVYGPGFKWDKYGSNDKSPQNNLDLLQSVDIVFTPDKSKWSKCIVFETGEVQANNRGADVGNTEVAPSTPFSKGSRKGMIRMDYSWEKDGTYSTTDVGRSWFPGYAVNVETGELLNIAFGESSDMGDQNGRDMIWNPTGDVYGKLDNGGSIPFIPLFGGKHFIYVMRTKYDEGTEMQQTLLNNYIVMNQGPAGASYPPEIRTFYNDILYSAIPYLNTGYKLNSVDNGLIPGELKVRIRVERPYTKFATDATFTDTLPRYQFSTIGMGVKQKDNAVAKSALDLIRIVPNPYLAYSSYETSSTDSKIKITNLPNKCTINIYTLEGVLVRTINRSVDGIDPETSRIIEISDGARLKEQGGTINLENTAEWDLTNEKNIPVASGIYLFDINAPGIGHKILKWFGALRPTDVSNF